MGTCASSQSPKSGKNRSPSAKVVDLEGRLHEFRRRTTAEEALSDHPGCYLCSAETMAINYSAPRLPQDHILQLDQIYFLMPLSKLLAPLSLQDLCGLAIKASAAVDSCDAGGSFIQDCRRLGFPG